MPTSSTVSPGAGTTAPDFTLPSTSGRDITLSDFRGKKSVLLAFFPLAFTSVCTAELCGFSDEFDQFSTNDVEVLPLSVDAIPSLKEFRNKHAMKVELLSDFKRTVSAAYGVLREDTGYSNRAYFLIDPSGVVRWAHVEETSRQRRENAEILEAIRNVRGWLAAYSGSDARISVPFEVLSGCAQGMPASSRHPLHVGRWPSVARLSSSLGPSQCSEPSPSRAGAELGLPSRRRP